MEVATLVLITGGWAGPGIVRGGARLDLRG